MKKIASLALAAAMTIPTVSFACEITDAELSTENNPTYNSSGARLWGVVDFDPAELANFELTIDGEVPFLANFNFVDGIEFVTNNHYLPVNTTHTIRTVFTLNDGTEKACETTVTIPEENAAPIIVHDRMVHYDRVIETENGVKVTVFANIIDTDQNVAAEDIEYELTAPAGVQVPAIELRGEGNYYVDMQEIEFTVPGDYSLRVKATDAYGEVAYSHPIEFSIDNCVESSIAEHTLAGRAQNVYGSYFTTGAYVYLGYQNGGDAVSLEKIDSLGDWWVVCQ